MSHETIIYGFIEGSTYTVGEYRKFQKLNEEIIKRLPLSFEDYPGFCKGMFSWPEKDSLKGCFRAQVIHFGGSFKNIDQGFTDIAQWVQKFEELLKKLYWVSVKVHFQTELVGELTFEYVASNKIFDSYHERVPTSTNEWERTFYDNGTKSTFEI